MSKVPDCMWLTTNEVIRHSLADLVAGTLVSVPGRRYQLLRALGRFGPKRVTCITVELIGGGRGWS